MILARANQSRNSAIGKVIGTSTIVNTLTFKYTTLPLFLTRMLLPSSRRSSQAFGSIFGKDFIETSQNLTDA